MPHPPRPAPLPFALFLPLLLLPGCRSRSETAGVVGPPPPPPPAARSSFSGARAYADLKAQCALGPRPPETTAHRRCGQFILKTLAPLVDKVDTQAFPFHDPDRRVTLHLTNIIGVINPQAAKKVLLFTHWDTRPTADNDLDHKDRPIVGADDGASGTAALLELARVFHARRPAVGVVLLFVDGEDWGPGENRMYLGSVYFAQHPGAYRPAYAILLDMIGDKDLDIYREGRSQDWDPEINDKVWAAAKALGYQTQFPDSVKYTIGDDHVPFHAAGIPAIDLIDFDYPYWHTLEDTADKCSPESLKAVGDVVAKVVYDEKP